MKKLACVVFLSACAGGFSLHSGGGGGVSSPTPNNTTILSSGGGKGSFDYNRDCSGEHGRVDWHRDPVLRWECFDYAELKGSVEYSEWAKTCDDLDAQLGASIACRMDHKSFDAHYAAEAKKERNVDRDSRDPADYCSTIMTEFEGRAALVTNTLGMMKRTPGAKKEAVAKIKQLTCAYDDERAGTVELQGNNLVLFTKAGQDAGWIFPSLRKTRQFPELEKVFTEYGECKGGFSC